MNENNENGRKSVIQDGQRVKLDTEPEVYEFDPLGEDTEFVTIGTLRETYENLKVVRFQHPTKEGEFIKFLVKRCDPGTSMLTYGTSVLRSAIRLAAMNERLQADKDTAVDVYEFIDDLKNTKEFMVLTVAMGLVEPRIPAKQVNEILPDYMLVALSSEINRGVVVLDSATERFSDNGGENPSESGEQPEPDGRGDGENLRSMGNRPNESEIQHDTEQPVVSDSEVSTREDSDK